MSDAYIYDAARTPRGKGRPDGALHEVTSVALSAGMLDAVIARAPAKAERAILVLIDGAGEDIDAEFLQPLDDRACQFRVVERQDARQRLDDRDLPPAGDTSAEVAARVAAARDRQSARFATFDLGERGPRCNAETPPGQMPPL